MRTRVAETGRWRRISGGALVRLQIDSERWAEQIPPVPEGHGVTVAFPTEDLAAEHAEAVELLGYAVVGAHEDSSRPQTADFLVAEALIEEHPAWWRALSALSDQVFVLHLGPVQRLLRDALRVHQHVLLG